MVTSAPGSGAAKADVTVRTPVPLSPERGEVSSDLKTWTTLTNLVGTNFAVTIRDPRVPARPMRFYRAIRL
jgi:hypothetical protein